jgi:hypothetical protein
MLVYVHNYNSIPSSLICSNMFMYTMCYNSLPVPLIYVCTLWKTCLLSSKESVSELKGSILVVIGSISWEYVITHFSVFDNTNISKDNA